MHVESTTKKIIIMGGEGLVPEEKGEKKMDVDTMTL